ncbi:hypothetical protein PR048_009866 [Dryococelus australis]|uniref:Reverse transcriptase/retrotransposon-derived protein RNase H-like domain-containing protein n=1 Tax=Dryococelus australis TaxID=614101 RepID=A0ABQ9I156_9NEOP|nr:hypothetical protein PR048_009866 [Dryococelus australis]
MVKYLSKFILNVSELSTPLRQLLEKNVAWHWEHDQDSAFETLKRSFKFPPVLTYYDYNRPVISSVDASSYSVASVLLQENQPIAYASKALTKAQLNYSQIEKEALVILTACKKFHQYVWGNKNLQIESDHKPHQAIFKKPHLSAPARLQRILFEVLPYKPTLIYVKGSQLYIADALSRDCHSTPEVDVSPTFEIHILIPLSKERTMELRRAVDSSEELSTLCTTILKGEELAVYKDVIFKGAQTLIWQHERTRSLTPTSPPQWHYRYLKTGKIPCFLAWNDTGHYLICPEVRSLQTITRESHPRTSYSRRHSVTPVDVCGF